MINLQTNCLGHVIKEGSCLDCKEDYDITHHPNNFDCSIYQNFLKKYEEVIILLAKRKINLRKEALEILSNQIFFANIKDKNITSTTMINQFLMRQDIKRDTEQMPLSAYTF